MKKLKIIAACVILTIVIAQYFFPHFGDWLNFWATFLGSIASGLIAYFIAKYQIDKEEKIKKIEEGKRYLPYFDIHENILNFGSYIDSVPILNVEIHCYNPALPIKNEYGEKNNVGSIYKYGTLFQKSGNIIKLEKYNENISYVDISCYLVNGASIFYTIGKDLKNGCGFVKWEWSDNYEQYTFNDYEGMNIFAEIRLSKFKSHGQNIEAWEY